ncbi:MAG: LacI family DNA-binding transcriptional regulator, partial [Anaerolineae bacterium]|nr:LacI family DNA-binding transcriptional regulator [Anaerolineae bacterium]
MTGRKKVTSVDVAQLAGVSQSTVSRIFTPSDIAVSADTRQKVLTAAKTLGYKPNAIARSLTTRRTNIIGLIMAGIDNPFYPYLLGKFTQRLQNVGLHILLFNTEYMQDSDEILSRVLQYQVDGLIVTAFPLSLDLAHECRRDGIPVVLFNQYAPDVPVSAVCCDIEAGGRVIADL